MPNVPNLPGVPTLTSYSANNVALLFADIVTAINGLFGPRWGIFLDGLQAFDYQSVVDFDFKQDWPISDYQVEEGSFLSYDKVELPFDVRVRVASGGTEAARESLLSSVRAAAGTLELYDVVTPEQTYESCNITHVDFRRTASNGVGLLIIDIWLLQIRESATSTFSNTQQPAQAGQVSTGNVSPVTANQRVNQAFDSGAWKVQ